MLISQHSMHTKKLKLQEKVKEIFFAQKEIL